MKILAALVLTSFFTLGCSHSLALRNNSTVDDYVKVDRRAGKGRGTVTVTDGTRHPAQAIRISPAAVSWRTPEHDMAPILREMGMRVAGPASHSVPTEVVREVRVKNVGRGTMEGTLFGLGAGAALSPLMLALISDGLNMETTSNVEVIVGTTLTSALLGSFIGAVIGSPTVIGVTLDANRSVTGPAW